MANVRIHQLTSDTGINITDIDLIPVDKYISPGVYNTVFKSGLNFKTYISNHVIALATASFTSINASINAVKPGIYNELHLRNVVTNSVVISNNVSTSLFCDVIENISYATGHRPIMLNIRVYARGTTGAAINKMSYGEYRLVLASNNGAIIGQSIIYEHNDPNIDIVTSGSFTISLVGGFYRLQCLNIQTSGVGTLVRVGMHVTTTIDLS
jgi:hypothetical protein